ncbi:MAG: cation:proton antiporter [Geminicoccaceae bacterium]
MVLFEWVVAILLGALLLTALARRVGAPYPAFLALGGAALAYLPGTPELAMDPELALALFVAPVLLDTAYDTSLRDLKANWRPVAGLAVGAVGVTTAAVALVAHALVPELPWAAAVAMGAVVAPPDAAAASAVLRQIRIPHHLQLILEGESLLNDATALMVLRLAIGAAAMGAFSPAELAPTFLIGVAGSLIAGPILGRLFVRLTERVQDTPSAIVLQFVATFGVWMVAEQIGLSGVLTIVSYALTISRYAPDRTPAEQRLPAYAVWETAVFVLNVLAFVLIGLQIRPILARLAPGEQTQYLLVAGAVLATVLLVRFAWVLGYGIAARSLRRKGPETPHFGSGLVVAWAGMRGLVTLAGAFALPATFPERDLILVAAFSVVLGTLILMGLSLRPLLVRLGLEDDDPVGQEVGRARSEALRAALGSLEATKTPAAGALRHEYEALLEQAEEDPRGKVIASSEHDELRRRAVKAAREVLSGLRSSDEIGDDAFHAIQDELDRVELSIR